MKCSSGGHFRIILKQPFQLRHAGATVRTAAQRRPQRGDGITPADDRLPYRILPDAETAADDASRIRRLPDALSVQQGVAFCEARVGIEKRLQSPHAPASVTRCPPRSPASAGLHAVPARCCVRRFAQPAAASHERWRIPLPTAAAVVRPPPSGVRLYATSKPKRGFPAIPGHRVPLPCGLPWQDPDGGLFTLRLARNRIAAPFHQRIHLSWRANPAFQCIGANASPSRIPSLMRTLATITPRGS